MENQPPPPSKTAEVDVPLHSIGFEIEELSPQRVSGHLPVTQKCCQVKPPLLYIYIYFLLQIISISSLFWFVRACIYDMMDGAGIQGVKWRGIGIDSRDFGKHRSTHSLWLSKSGWDSAQHQPFETCWTWWLGLCWSHPSWCWQNHSGKIPHFVEQC